MNDLPIDQQFSEKTLKGFLMKNVQPGAQDPRVKDLNSYLVARVDRFWDDVAVPLIKNGVFNPEKIVWYYEIYKEGIEARRVNQNPFVHVPVTQEIIDNIVDELLVLNVPELCDLGGTYLSSAYTVLCSWYRDELISKRYRLLYVSENPVDWITSAQAEEDGLMMMSATEGKPEVTDLLTRIGLIISRRV